MGFSTRFLGRLDIEPPLNPSEVAWLTAYAELDRRHFTDPYEVPVNPRAFRLEQERQRAEEFRQPPARSGTSGRRAVTRDAFTTLTPGDGTPYPHLDWIPCRSGCCLIWDSATEKSRMAEAWLTFLIDHFLRPGAMARHSAKPDFAEFTFDHVLNGVIAAERDDTRELWLIRCRDNEISTQQLVPPDVMPWDVVPWDLQP
ncbi:hypothetical protein GCM10009721_11640 [Terrabacter tumescens]|uniref:Uncharacterized protein n=1 Tax=Terrabacter tumescens TaxID=60443 RepID=A0ABQ2HS09_9MICO|nr:hypothetical protein [Terrabacter tumescens]GGM88294.1 hypothetical protein GCM10009721_11640 [Terrabacter tumescens]